MKTPISRRSALARITSSTAVAVATASLARRLQAADDAAGAALKGRINHSVCKWCYSKVSLEDMCTAGKKMGLQSVELLLVSDFPTLKNHAFIRARCGGRRGGIESGLNPLKNHQKIAEWFKKTIPAVAEA